MIDMVLWNILIQRFRVCKASKVLVLRDAGGINGTNGNGRPHNYHYSGYGQTKGTTTLNEFLR